MGATGRDRTVRVMSLAVKCGRPPSPDGLIGRPRLVESMGRGREHALLSIVAPPGYGKTSLLAEWTAQDPRPSVWIALEPWHRDPMALLAELLHELNELEPCDMRSFEEAACASNGLTSELLSDVTSTLEARRRPTTIVLDDAQTIDGTRSWQLLSEIVEHLPRGSQLVIASRTRPTLRLGRLRAHRALLELDATDLAMTRPEARDLLRAVGLEPSSEELSAILHSTEGWAAGLYLAALSSSEEGHTGSDLRHFSGETNVVADYLRDELPEELSHEDFEFLVLTSVSERLSGSLCDALVDRPGSSLTLDRLRYSGLPLFALDSPNEEYRCHRMLREMLLGELRHQSPSLEIELHRRASDWHGRHGNVEDAIDHAILAGDIARVGELLWASLPRYLAAEPASDGEHQLSGLLRRLTPEQLRESAALALTAAYESLARGKARQAEHWGLVANAALERAPQSSDPVSLRLGSAILHAALAPGGVAVMRRDAAMACELAPADSPWRSICCLLHGVAYELSGERAQAREWLEEAVRCSAVATPMGEALCLAELALLTAEEGDLEQGIELIEGACAHVERHGLAANPAAALAFAVSADLRSRYQYMDEAKRDLRRATELLAGLGDFIAWYEIQTRVALARAVLRLADTRTARALLAESSRLARRMPDAPILRQWLDEAWGLVDSVASNALVGPSALTMAELRILRFLPTHLSLREIGDRLHVSTNTVKTQAHAVYRKLGASSRSEAVARASEIGLI